MHSKTTGRSNTAQVPGGLERLAEILDTADFGLLLGELEEVRYHSPGPSGYPQDKLLRAYLLSYLLNLQNTSSLVRALRDSADLRRLCGFRRRLPHRTTFGRFFSMLSGHIELVEECLADLTDQVAEVLPGFGETVAVDSTTVGTFANPNRKVVKDPDATWTKKPTAKASAKDGKEWSFGYKYHLVACARYDLPLFGFTTSANHVDSPELPGLLDGAADTHPWFSPDHVIADKGYDSRANHEAVIERGAAPIIAIRRPDKRWDQPLHEEVYAEDGTPTCVGMEKMEYVRSDPEKGHLFECPKHGCRLQSRLGVLYCREQIWEKPDNPRYLGPIPRSTETWRHLYAKRQSIERVFKSAKQSLRLERHCFMGLPKIALHAALTFLVFQMTVKFNLLFGPPERLRWMVEPVN